MKSGMGIPKSIDEYIAGFPKDIQEVLSKLRETIRKTAPDAQEIISYQMPAYKLNGILVYFAAMTKHIGFYPTSSGIEKFQKELSPYKTGRGSVQFPLNQPLPVSLIARIVSFRVSENVAKKEAKVKSIQKTKSKK